MNSTSVIAKEALLKDLQGYNDTYQNSHNIADYSHSQDVLLTIGEQLYQSINSHPTLLQEWLNDIGSRQLAILVDSTPTPLQALLLNLPWEIMAVKGEFLMSDDRLYEVSRRIGIANDNPPEAKYKDLNLTFMAADPNFDSGLQYEAEERAILMATQNSRNLNLIVEESGNLN